MKRFALASVGMVAAQAASTREFVEGVGENATSGQFVRVATGTAQNVIGADVQAVNALDDISWTMTTYSVYYEDSGETRIRIKHELEANIFATDTVMFEVAFRPLSLPNPTDISTIGEDYVQCEMSQSTSDGFFWTASVAEGYYVCKAGNTDATNVCVGVDQYLDEDTNYTSVPESTSDWVTPYSDDDPSSPWCTHTNTKVGATLSPFECSKLICVVERIADTGDTEQDLAFTPSTNERLVIQQGRAKLYINKDETEFVNAVVNLDATALSFNVPEGASNLLATATSLAAILLTVF